MCPRVLAANVDEGADTKGVVEGGEEEDIFTAER